MKPSSVLKKLFTGACIYYAAFSLALLLINVILAGGAAGKIPGVLNMLLLFPFSLLLSGAEFIRKNDRLSEIVRISLHYLIFTTACILFLWLPSNASKEFRFVLGMIVLISLLYWLVYLICRLTVKRFHSFREE